MGSVSENTRVMPNPDIENIDCKAVRKRLGLTAIEFAKLLGVRVETISRWEHGHHRPTGLYAIRLAEIAQQAQAKADEPKGR